MKYTQTAYKTKTSNANATRESLQEEATEIKKKPIYCQTALHLTEFQSGFLHAISFCVVFFHREVLRMSNRKQKIARKKKLEHFFVLVSAAI